MRMSKYIQDAGHGGVDGGASGNALVEKNLTLEASTYVNKRLNELGITSTTTRGGDYGLTQSERTGKVKNSKAKVCLSHHWNSATAVSGNGVETIFSIYSDGKLANAILSSIVNATGLKRRTAFTKKYGNNDYYFMHRETGTVETVIIEYGFVSNKGDADYYRDKKNREKAYEAVIKAVCEYEKVKYVPLKVEGVTGKDVLDKLEKDGVVLNKAYWLTKLKEVESLETLLIKINNKYL